MYDREKFTPEFYDKLSDSEKKELVQVMLEDQLTDPLHIKGLPKPIQYSIKSAVKMPVKDMKKETIAGYPVGWIDGIKSKDEDDYLLTGATKNFKPNQEFDRLQKIVDESVSNEQYTEDSILDYINEDYFKSEDNYLMKLLGMDVQSYSIDEFPMLPEPITTVQLYDVIHWNHVHINYTFGLKAKDCRARYALEELIGYNDLSPISRMIVDSLKVNGPEMLKQGKSVGPNFNEDKKRLERVINRRKKK